MTQVGDVGVGGKRRWLVLALGLAAQTASCSFLYGLPFLVPSMQRAEGLSLAEAGTVVAAPSLGLLFTLILWGAAADRYGERLVMALGLGGSGLLLVYAAVGDHSLAVLFGVFLLAGASTASVNAASGRAVLGWFGPAERGFAMGIRQMAQPLGVGVAAFGLPPLADRWGFQVSLILPASTAIAVALLVARLLVDPPRPEAEAGKREKPPSPYRKPALWRVHGASALLVVPQFTVSAFTPVYLVTMHGWTAASAGWFVGAVQILGALGRIVSGYWSDRAGSRLRPMRQLAVASAAVMLLVALGDATWPWLVLLALVLAAVITVSDNGLGFTASAEMAGLAWAGRAMGTQNTGQNIAAALTPPLLGLVIGDARYALAFCVAAVFPMLAVAVVPVRHEKDPSGRT
ncbi:MFS transporter [Amycolatopsis sp. QT-25]|uniref:MFS transporter n=1 Tax=Amycolatopsis sp. QT-25 TaxID=3034022 RepID=UPI0023EA99D6|nr:MFS transporter [Amycolatopsis sp. QT-25]WET80441.1 MFS transporter [Amycolatopsis sp. QT-25]